MEIIVLLLLIMTPGVYWLDKPCSSMISVNSSLVMGTSRLTAETSDALLQFNTPTTFLVLQQG